MTYANVRALTEKDQLMYAELANEMAAHNRRRRIEKIQSIALVGGIIAGACYVTWKLDPINRALDAQGTPLQ